MSGIDLIDPEVIRTFRARLAVFVGICGSALGSRASELNRTRDWLRGEQLPHWRRQLIRREELFQQARRAWLDAESEVSDQMSTRGPRKPSSIEERVAMERARRLRDEADERLETIRRWLLRLDQDGDPLLLACQGHECDLRDRGVRALARLDALSERVDDYLAIATTTPAPPNVP